MPKPTTAFLVCIYDQTSKLIKRRIALNECDGVDFVYTYAENLGATVVEDSHGCSGKIVGDVTHTYDLTNIAVV